MTDMSGFGGLIFDIGASEGDDTAFYLAKGFRVVSVEADPEAAQKLNIRFASQLSSGQLTVLNMAAWSSSGMELDFFINRNAQGHSALDATNTKKTVAGDIVRVESTGYSDLVGKFGVPRYCKLDIEGAEAAFLSGMKGAPLPKFISVECHTIAPVMEMFRLGFVKFKLVNQCLLSHFAPPDPPREGVHLRNWQFKHSSGFFGEELPGDRWLSFDEFCAVFHSVSHLRAHRGILGGSWFDCHATT